MRHKSKKITLDRKAGPRKALLVNLIESLILYEKIKTTIAKAKAIKPIVEKLVTKAQKGDLSTRRQLISSLHTDNVVKKLMEELGPRYKERAGGYTRIVKLDNRLGDGAQEAIIEFV